MFYPDQYKEIVHGCNGTIDNMWMEGMEYVYVASMYHQGLYKIGSSKRDPQVRVRELSSKTVYPLQLMGFIKAYKASALEKVLHNIFSGKRNIPLGEWFYLEYRDLQWLRGLYMIDGETLESRIKLEEERERSLYIKVPKLS